jgi:diguanylate cyclase (GGDEF)-like protein/PAS domain S-box-containing protein
MEKTKILVVEDESLVAANIQSMLKSLGYDVSGVVSSGEQAIQKVAETSPHLVLMDIVLKGSIDGIKAAETIWAKFNVPVVYLTAYADEPTLQRAKLTKPFGYLLKPFEERDLQTTIEMALYKSQMEMKLNERERWLSTVLKNIDDAVVAADQEGYLTFMNPLAERLTGWNLDLNKKKHLRNVLNLKNEKEDGSPGEEVKIAIKNIAQEGAWDLPRRCILISKEGYPLPIELGSAFLRDEKEEITGIVLVFRDITERKKYEQQLRYNAIHDPLTDLPNRAFFDELLTKTLQQARRKKHNLAVLMLDLDYFKKVNDTLGHNVGDKLLVAVAEKIKNSVREEDTVARLGGDEYLLLLTDISHLEGAISIAQRILDIFQTPFDLKDAEIQITTSIGIALFPDHGEDAETLIKNADMAMYQAKDDGRNNYKVFNPQKVYWAQD